MTCIVGLVHEGSVYMGADSAGVSGYDLSIRADEKVFVNDNFLMGFTSSFRMGQLLRYSFVPPLHHPDEDLNKYFVVNFINAVRKCFKDGGYVRIKDDEETGGQFLIGYEGQLFNVDSDFQVGRPLDPYDAVGSGANIALGVLYATEDSGLTPEQRIELALTAAEHHNAGVRAPFHIERL